MKKTALCFTRQGEEVLRRLNAAAQEKGIGAIELRTGRKDASAQEFPLLEGSIDSWTAEGFREGKCLIFVSAMGIAVRAVAPYVKDKLSDSPVIVIDDGGSFVIPLLSGHAGGANKIAAVLAELLGAQAVITTSTDANAAFSADVFAVENRLRIRNREGIRKVSARALEGKSITLSVKHYPPEGPVDVVVADETEAEYSLLFSPKAYTLGIGMRRGKDAAEAEDFLLRVLSQHGIEPDEVYALCTIDIKEEEPALKQFSQKYRIPLISFDAALLREAQGEFEASSFVEQQVGVDNVCQRAAMLGAGSGAVMLSGKLRGEGITAAICRRKV